MPSVIDAIINGHVQGIAAYLGLSKKLKEDEQVDKVTVIVNGDRADDGMFGLITGINGNVKELDERQIDATQD